MKKKNKSLITVNEQDDTMLWEPTGEHTAGEIYMYLTVNTMMWGTYP